MKKYALSLMLLFPFALFAQLIKSVPTAKPAIVSTTKAPVPTEEEKIKKSSEEWFKKVYVETTFKDPYSYKLLKHTIEPATLKKALEDSLSYATIVLRVGDTTFIARRSITISDYKEMIKKNEVSISKTKNKDLIESYNRTIEMYKGFILSREKDTIRDREAYSQKLKEVEKYKSKLSGLTEADGNKIYCYNVYLDCHGSNSYGNPILGRYFFSFKDGGLLPNTKVVKLND